MVKFWVKDIIHRELNQVMDLFQIHVLVMQKWLQFGICGIHVVVILSASIISRKSRGFYEKIFKKVTLYIVRIDTEGKYKNSAPCKNCFRIITELNIKKIIFSTDDDFVSYKTEDFQTDHISNGNKFLQKRVYNECCKVC